MKKLLILLFTVNFTSCTLLDGFDETPMFIQVDSVSLSTNGNQGWPSHKISDIEVFADGFSVGVFNLPAKVPVLQTNDSIDITIAPVIRNNGISSNPVKYPFYQNLDFSFLFEEGTTIPLSPTFKYRNDAVIVPICDFEISNCINLDFDQNINIGFIKSSDTEYGDFSGLIEIEEANTFFEKGSFTQINKSLLSNNIAFLEMDYKCEIGFGIGVILSGQGVPDFPAYKIVLKPQETWNKIYIEISQLISPSNVEGFRILFGTTTATTIPGKIWVDNLRVVHF
ncbi:MAG: hypothetical protein HKO66_05625 [Saprospiraceae bacterium]|nr:hypothetical protein [Bacteroidia bacterium]NNL91689.1 hypothetical protein [Saprospiraceae bacterium]